MRLRVNYRNVSVSELADTRRQLNGTQTELKEKETRLGETERKLNNTELDLQEVSAALNHTRALLEEARRLEAVSKWDVLYTPSYLNKIFTRQLYNQLTNSWTLMGKILIVRKFIRHLMSYQYFHILVRITLKFVATDII